MPFSGYVPLPPPADLASFRRPPSARSTRLCIPLRSAGARDGSATPRGTALPSPRADGADKSREPLVATARMCQLDAPAAAGTVVPLHAEADSYPRLSSRHYTARLRSALRKPSRNNAESGGQPEENSGGAGPPPAAAPAQPSAMLRPLSGGSCGRCAVRAMSTPRRGSRPAASAQAPSSNEGRATAGDSMAAHVSDAEYEKNPLHDLANNDDGNRDVVGAARGLGDNTTTNTGSSSTPKNDAQSVFRRLYDPGFRRKRQQRLLKQLEGRVVVDEYHDKLRRTTEAFFSKPASRIVPIF